jgi:GTP pyrophosphokinase
VEATYWTGMAVALSKSQIDKAGASLRAYVDQGVDCDLDDVIKVIETYRAAYVMPLRVAQATAARAASLHTDRPVVARHKRTVRVIDKLVRFPSMRLSQMDDIGGCRIVVADPAAQRSVLEEVLEVRPAAQVQDYVASPKTTGYRAVHAIVLCDGLRMEVQIRTHRQNEWADVVERTSDRLGMELKDGVGDPDILEYFRLTADKLDLEDQGGRVDEDIENRLAEARRRARPFFASRVDPRA